MYATLAVAKTYADCLLQATVYHLRTKPKWIIFTSEWQQWHCQNSHYYFGRVSWPSLMPVHLLSHRVCAMNWRVGFSGITPMLQTAQNSWMLFFLENEILNWTAIYLKSVKIIWYSIKSELKTIFIQFGGSTKEVMFLVVNVFRHAGSILLNRHFKDFLLEEIWKISYRRKFEA